MLVLGEGGSYQRRADACDHFFLRNFDERGKGEEIFRIGERMLPVGGVDQGWVEEGAAADLGDAFALGLLAVSWAASPSWASIRVEIWRAPCGIGEGGDLSLGIVEGGGLGFGSDARRERWRFRGRAAGTQMPEALRQERPPIGGD